MRNALVRNNPSLGGFAVQLPGSRVGQGLSQAAAGELGGLVPGTPVGTSLIDAHAGMLGMLAVAGHDQLEGRLGKYTTTKVSKDVSFFTHYYSHNVYSEKSKFKFRS
jgi:ribulose kinase